MRPTRTVISSAVFAAVVCVAMVPRAGGDPDASSNREERINRLAEIAGVSAEPDAAYTGRRIGPTNGEVTAPAIFNATAPEPGFAAGDHSTKPGGSLDSTSGGGGGWALSTITALGIVIGLILILRWVWLRMGGRVVAGHSPVVETLSRTSVAPKNHVVLVRVGSRILVCGDSPSGLRTLADIDDEEEVAALLSAVSASRETSLTRGFNQMLHRFHGEHDASTEGGDESEHRIDRARDSVSSLLANIRGLAGKGGT